MITRALIWQGMLVAVCAFGVQPVCAQTPEPAGDDEPYVPLVPDSPLLPEPSADDPDTGMGPPAPILVGLNERETRSRVEFYLDSDHWVMQGLILLSMEVSWHPSGSEILLEAFDDRDMRLHAFALETMLRAKPEELAACVSAELLGELVEGQLRVKHELYRQGVLEVLARVAPYVEATKVREWRSWWRKERKVYVPPPWSAPEPPPFVSGGSDETVTVVARAFDLRQAGLDLAIVVDSTGSMQPTIDRTRDALTELVVMLRGVAPQFRLGLVHYRELGELDDGAQLLTPLTGDVSAVHGLLAGLTAGGGGDFPERVEKGLEIAFSQKMRWRMGANKIVLVIGDAPPHPGAIPLAVAMARKGFEDPYAAIGAREPVITGRPSRKERTRPFVTACIGVGTGPEDPFRAIAEAGGGVYGSIPGVGSPPQRGPGRRDSGAAIQAIVEHILVLSFGSRWATQIERFVDVFYTYRRAGLFR